jgi:preprotein translocase subunit YajC
MNARNDLMSGIKKGTKIVTTAGVYGVVESVEETTDGKVVTIKTGSSKNPSTMTIHMNAIMGIDNKTSVKGSKKEEVEETIEAEEVAENEEVKEEKPVAKKSTKKSSK